VIDPLGPLISTDDSDSRVKDHARMLLYSLQGQDKTTTLVTNHSARRSTHGIEEYLVSGTIVLEMKIAKDRCARILTVEKMRSTAFNPAQYRFSIVSAKGVELQPNDVHCDQSHGGMELPS
jgi:KaiC/GvpD/RAD55 family RecA-like ATPase